MSEYSTSSPSIEHTRRYLIRPPSTACTWLNRMSWSSVAVYSFTPMLTRPKDTAPRQIDRMPVLLSRDPSRGPRAGKAGAVKITRIGPLAAGRQVERSRLLRTEESLHAGLLAAGGERAVLDRVVHELQDVGAGDQGHGEGGQAGGPRRGHVTEDQRGRHPLRQAERAGEQLSDGVLDPAVLADLLGDLGVTRRALEGGEGRPQRAGHRVLGDAPGQPEGGHRQQCRVARGDPIGQLPARGADGGRGGRHQAEVDAHRTEIAGQRAGLALRVLTLLVAGPPADRGPDPLEVVCESHGDRATHWRGRHAERARPVSGSRVTHGAGSDG